MSRRAVGGWALAAGCYPPAVQSASFESCRTAQQLHSVAAQLSSCTQCPVSQPAHQVLAIAVEAHAAGIQVDAAANDITSRPLR